MALGLVVRLDRFAPWGELVDDGYVEVSVERHRQRPRDGRGAHGEDMRVPRGVLRPQPRALHDTEAVLLVDDCQPEMGELHHGL